MNAVATPAEIGAQPSQSRQAASGSAPAVLTDIYQSDTNIAIWQRQLSCATEQAVRHVLSVKPTLQASMTVNPLNVNEALLDVLGDSSETGVLIDDIAQLVDMFCCLFELNRTGLRLTSLDRAMCPRFHVDRVPCRLVTTFHGQATQWLPHQVVDRSKLGTGNQVKPDELSGLMNSVSDIQQLNAGDVALLKGELWQGNEGAGLVHRSPQLPDDNRRLLLTLDFVDG